MNVFVEIFDPFDTKLRRVDQILVYFVKRLILTSSVVVVRLNHLNQVVILDRDRHRYNSGLIKRRLLVILHNRLEPIRELVVVVWTT